MYIREILGVGCVYAVLRVEGVQLFGQHDSGNSACDIEQRNRKR
jgi:hypothetical protein